MNYRIWFLFLNLIPVAPLCGEEGDLGFIRIEKHSKLLRIQIHDLVAEKLMITPSPLWKCFQVEEVSVCEMQFEKGKVVHFEPDRPELDLIPYEPGTHQGWALLKSDGSLRIKFEASEEIVKTLTEGKADNFKNEEIQCGRRPYLVRSRGGSKRRILVMVCDLKTSKD